MAKLPNQDFNERGGIGDALTQWIEKRSGVYRSILMAGVMSTLFLFTRFVTVKEFETYKVEHAKEEERSKAEQQKLWDEINKRLDSRLDRIERKLDNFHASIDSSECCNGVSNAATSGTR